MQKHGILIICSLIGLGILALAAVVWVALILQVFSGARPYIPDPVYSPDGSKVIIPTVDFNKENQDTYLLIHIKIEDAESGEALFQVQTRASDRMRWSVSWLDNDTFLLDSSDIGHYCWEELADAWNEISCP